MDSTKKNDITSCNSIDEPVSSSQENPAQKLTSGDNELMIKNDTGPLDHDTSEQRNDSSSFSTAFTISFEDDNNTSKKLGIRDSIRKFAPPKPHTIEKSRQPKSDQSQDHSLISIESAPAGLSKHSHRKGCSNSSRSSSRKSNSSRHSNISESAAFLIDRMLNCKQQVDGDKEPSSSGRNGPPSANNSNHANSPSIQSKKSSHPSKRMTHSSDDILDNEIDYCEDKSDNGTYIVGADPESDAARKKIDELFGVVKAAEASVIADSASRNHEIITRPSRLTNKKPLNRERQEHINRLASRNNSSMSRSSSSSRQENNVSTDHQPRISSRHSRNSSCDRTSRANRTGSGNRPRRSVSQSSRQSSNKELSDGDTRSSRSSLHTDIDVTVNDNSISNHPSMKFNRAFALRRARLGLGEPSRVTSTQQESEPMNNLSSSQRRHQINTNTYKASQISSGSANFSRDDGGRFSLRMKNNALPSRLNSIHTSNRSPQHSTLLDNYIGKVSGMKIATNINNPLLQQEPKQTHQPYTSTALPYQSGDELETMSPSRYRLLLKTGRLQKKGLTELESDTDSYNNSRFNYSLGSAVDYDTNNYSLNESRTGSSAGKRGSVLQLGALDSLVISAISSLSLKIRHSVCDVLVEHAKKLPVENETRLIVEEILPQLTANSSSSKSPTSIEEIDQSLYFDLAKTLKNLKKVEQMVDVITLISNQLPTISHNDNSSFKSTGQGTGNVRTSDSTTNSEITSMNDLSPV